MMKTIVRRVLKTGISTALGLAALPAAAQELTLIASVQRALASAPETFSAPTLEQVWNNVDTWSKQQNAAAGARASVGAARYLPPHLRDQNALARYAESELLLLPQRNVSHAAPHALRAGAFTVGKPTEVAFADRSDSPDSAVGVVIEFEGDVTFAGDLPEAGRLAATQAQNLGELIHAVVPGQPTKITLVPLAAKPTAQMGEVRRELAQRFAGVEIAVRPDWP